MFYFVISLILVLSAVVFALSNAEPVEVSFLFWAFEGSLALMLLLTFLLGVLAALLMLIPGYFKKSKKKVKESSTLLHSDSNEKENTSPHNSAL